LPNALPLTVALFYESGITSAVSRENCDRMIALCKEGAPAPVKNCQT